MDSRTGFALLLVLAGLAGMWALVEGYVQRWITAARAQAAPAAAAPASSSSATKAATPATSTSGKASADGLDWLYPFGRPTAIPATPPIIDPHLVLGSGAAAFGATIGGDGIAIEPIGGVRVLGAT